MPECGHRTKSVLHLSSSYKRIEKDRNGSSDVAELRVLFTIYLVLPSFGSALKQTQNLAKGDSRGGSTPPSGTMFLPPEKALSPFRILA